MQALVLDTNIVLDLWVFDEPQVTLLRQWLQARAMRWLATPAMRDELARVLGYSPIAASLQFHGRTAGEVLQRFDDLAQLQAPPAPARWRCKDADDQAFIDLALAQRCPVLSKDKAVLCMKNRLLAGDSTAQTAIEFIASVGPLAGATGTPFKPALPPTQPALALNAN